MPARFEWPSWSSKVRQHREDLVRCMFHYFLRCMCCCLAISARFKDHLAFILSRLNSFRVCVTAIERLPCFHLTLQTSCDNIFFVFEILSYGASSYVTAWENTGPGIAARWHFAGRQLPTTDFPRKMMQLPFICDLSVTLRGLEPDRIASTVTFMVFPLTKVQPYYLKTGTQL